MSDPRNYSDAYNTGYEAAIRGDDVCPYSDGTWECEEWLRGYSDAE